MKPKSHRQPRYWNRSFPPPPPLSELGGTADDAFSDEEGGREESKGEGEEDEAPPPRKEISLFMGYVRAGYIVGCVGARAL